MSNINIHICENNNLGHRSGRTKRIDFSFESDGDIFMQLETTDISGEPIISGASNITMYDFTIHHGNCLKWAGNMLWNMYLVNASQALGFIKLLRATKKWHCTEAWSNLMAKWDAGEEINGADLELPEDIKPVIEDPNQIKLF